MKNFGAKWLALAMVVGVGATTSLNGCSDGPTTSPIGGTTGGAGRGGTTGSAGSGGSTGGRGGTTGNAGRGGTGTAGATAGTTGSAGTGGGAVGGMTGCASLVGFDTGLDGFAHNMFNTGATNLFLVGLDGGTPATLVHDTSMGSPTLGSMKSDAPFSDFKQFIDLQKGYAMTDLKDWTGYKLHVRVRIASGLNTDSTQPNGIQPYVSSYNAVDGGAPGYHFKGTYSSVPTTNRDWAEYVADIGTASGDFDPSKIVNFGVLIQSGDGTATATKPTAAVVYVDSFWLEGSCGATGTGGAGGAAGGTTGTGGAAGGTTGTGGAAGGTTGTGGAAGGTTGTGGAAGGTGTAGATGTGGAATSTLYDFEAGVQSWGTTTPTTVTASTEQHFDGAQSLKMTYGALDGTNVTTSVSSPAPALWPGTVLTFHAYLPAGFDTTGAAFFQAVSQSNNYKLFDSTGNGTRTATAGAWNTWTYTVPNTFPGGLQMLGFQLGDNTGGTTVPAGSVYLDAITATGGTQNCAVATGTGAHTFEAALDANVYKKDGSETDTVAAQSTDRANGGTGSWKVAFTALPAPASGATTSRRVFIDGPSIYCGQVATVHVYLPAASDGLTFQVFTLYNNYAKNSFTGPATVTRAGWTTYAFTVPSDVGPGGIQQLGVQLNWTGTATFTGNVYIDDITW